MVGLKTQEIAVGTQTSVSVSMQEDATELSEVVVTALGVTREQRSLGYAQQGVDGASLAQIKEANVVNSLAGKVAGVQISNSGNMGGSARIVIRGVRSVQGNNQPLFVVDGVPLDNSNFTTSNQARGAGGYDYGNSAQDINPDDVESMQVLKGAAAAALYGSRASNGVILITTKSGKSKKKGVGVSVNSGVVFESVLRLPDYQNEYGGGANADWDAKNSKGLRVYPLDENGYPISDMNTDESWGPKLDGKLVRQWYSYNPTDADFGKATPWVGDPDNVKNFFNTGVTFNNNVALSGGTDRSAFRLSYTDMRLTGIMPNSEMQRHTISINSSSKLTDKLEASIGGNYVSSKATGRPGTGYDGANVMQQFNQWGQRQWNNDKMSVYKTSDGQHLTWNRTSTTNPAPKYSDNPYWTRYMNYQDDDRERFYGNMALVYKITPALSVSGKAMTDFYTDSRRERVAVGSQDIPFYSEDIRFVKEDNFEAMLRFNKNITDKFSVNAFGGINVRKERYERNYGETVNGLVLAGLYNLKNSVATANSIEYSSRKQVNSAFASTSFGYNQMLFLDATLRADQSSTLPKDSNTYFYPSVSTSFVFSELPALAKYEFFSFGKIRAGWAQVGNDTGPYNTKNVYVARTSGAFNSNSVWLVDNTLRNEALKPEKNTAIELGLEMKFFKNRLGFDATFYDNLSEDQIISLRTSGTTGYASQVMNSGKMRNRGVELMLSATPVQTASGFTWDVSMNWARNYNEVEELIDGLDNLSLANAPFGVTVNAFKGEPYGQILGFGYARDAQGRILTEDGFPYTDGKMRVLGTALSKWTGGITNTFTYKNISLRTLIDAQYGGHAFSTTNMWGKYSGMFKNSTEGGVRENGITFKGVNADGTPNTTVVSAQDYFQTDNGYTIQESDVYSTEFVKLREVALSYQFPNKLTGRWGINNLTISAVGRNLAILHDKFPNIDPEMASGVSATNVQGIEGGQLPSTRTWGFNLKFDF